MLLRLIGFAGILFSLSSARASQTEAWRGILHSGRDGASLELFDTGERVRLDGIPDDLLRRHAGREATVYGTQALPTSSGELPMVYVDRITITVEVPAITVEAPRVHDPDGYTPPRTSGERAADALKVIPFAF